MPLFFDDKSPRAKKENFDNNQDAHSKKSAARSDEEERGIPLFADDITDEDILLSPDYSSDDEAEANTVVFADDPDDEASEVTNLLAKAEKKYSVFSSSEDVKKDAFNFPGIESSAQEKKPVITRSRLAEEFNNNPREYIQPGVRKSGIKPLIIKEEGVSKSQNNTKDMLMVFAVKFMPIILIVGLAMSFIGAIIYLTYLLTK